MENLTFTVDSALLNELGEKLVETVYIALIELVKNSYDADATQVNIRFMESENEGFEIHVVDNGIGMSLDEVKKYWMRIATTNKNENRRSPLFGRPKTGSKGIGRFSCRRLGTRLKLITTAKIKGNNNIVYQKTEVSFPWLEFKAGTDVTKIRCPGKTYFIDKEPTGTTLIIGGSSKTEWTKRGYDYLKRQLAVLVANRGQKRKGYKDDPGFNILLDIPRFEGEIKDLRDELISAGWGTINARVNDKHQAVCNLEAMGIGSRRITGQRRFDHLTGVSLKIGLIVDDATQIRNKSILSKGKIREILPEWGGVQVRYNGFRVYPYGDDDWLKIDHDRALRKGAAKDELHSFALTLEGIDPSRALLQLVSMRNHVGNVDIDSRATGFEMKANREGFITSEAVDELRSFVRFCIDWATIYRDYYIKSVARQAADVSRKELERVSKSQVLSSQVVESAVRFIKDEIYRLPQRLSPLEKKEIEKTISTATEAILKHEESNKEELRHLRLVASTSTLLLIFSHEVKSLLGALDNSENALKVIQDKLTSQDRDLVRGIRESLSESKRRFDDLLGMTSLIGVDSRSAKPGKLALLERIEKAGKCFQLIINSYDIGVDYTEVPNNIVVNNMLEAELYAILLNVLSNSIKSVIGAGGDKKIKFTSSRENGKTIIRIMDTGLGLDPSHYEDVFVPFVADPDGRLYEKLKHNLNPEDKYIVGTGSGLGLSIVREIVQVHNGSISFAKPKTDWSAELEIVLP